MADLQDVIDNLKNEGALTRNKGTNSTKSVKEILIRNSEKQIAFQDSLITRLADSVRPTDAGPSPAEQKQDDEDEANADKKQNMILQKIGAGISGLLEIGKKGAKAAALGGLAILSTLAIGAFLIALGKFLQSQAFKDLTKFISDVILPKLLSFWEFVKSNWEEIAVLIGGIITVLAITKFVELATKVKNAFLAIRTFMLVTMLENVKGMIGGALTAGKNTFTMVATLIKNAFIAVKTFMLSTMLPAVTGMIGSAMSAGKNSFVAVAGLIRKAFTAVRTFMLLTMLPAVTAFMAPLLPVIAIAAAVSLVLYALYEAFQDFRNTLETTGSIGEAIKVAIGKFVGVLLGAIPSLFLELVKFVANMFGFKEFAKMIGDIDPIQFIADAVTGLFDQIGKFFKMLFDFDFTGFLAKNVPGAAAVMDALGIGGGEDDGTDPGAAPAHMRTAEIAATVAKMGDKSDKDIERRTNLLASQMAGQQKRIDKMTGATKTPAEQILIEKNAALATELKALEDEKARRLKGSAESAVNATAKTGELINQNLKESQELARQVQQQLDDSRMQQNQVIVNTDNSQKINTTGPTGNHNIRPQFYGGRMGNAYEMEGY